MQDRKIGFFRAYGSFWKNYANFGSRTTKEAFWKAWFFQNLIIFVLTLPYYGVLTEIMEQGNIFAVFWLLPCSVYCLATIIPMIAMIIRRLHDTDRNGCWFFLYLIPIAGIICFFIMLSKPTAPYDVYPGKSGRGPYATPQVPPGYVLPSYMRPRGFAPLAGGNRAGAAIALSIVLIVASYGYSAAINIYMYENADRYLDSLSDQYSGFLEGNDYYDWYSDDYPEGFDPWDYYDYYSGDDYSDLSEDEQAAIENVRNGTLSGLTEFSIEDVLLSRVDDEGLMWDCYSESSLEGGETVFYVSAGGFSADSGETVYGDFDLYENRRVEIYSLTEDGTDFYGDDAREVYEQWYHEILAKTGDANRI